METIFLFILQVRKLRYRGVVWFAWGPTVDLVLSQTGAQACWATSHWPAVTSLRPPGRFPDPSFLFSQNNLLVEECFGESQL